ncbi:Proteasomal ubiquitin receptor ADRM1 [Trichinella pseudospiralis]|uniref:Proteasomal ubiquitin receptor ADRM1 n=1 Tax=Trichinella pseudospiralis TaxID=6337 RepID=A0A0V1JB21_TRIPS|nr:Proteasomal ubiquitin receptor ADRM1 [Trichinella pseudospiralis]KRZ32153.1 Proteasomal ubiquitin receptor ADRM1 [Trichinella pseudospiralis]
MQIRLQRYSATAIEISVPQAHRYNRAPLAYRRRGVLMEFFAGKMHLVGNRLYPDKRLGVCFIHLGNDNFFHFCWKDRKTGIVEDDILIVPGIGNFSKYLKRSQMVVRGEEVNDFFNYNSLKFSDFIAENLFMIYGMDPPKNLPKCPIQLDESEPDEELEDANSVDSEKSFMEMLERVRKTLISLENELSSKKLHVQVTAGSPSTPKLQKSKIPPVNKKENLNKDPANYEADDEDTTTKKSESTNKPKNDITNSSIKKDKIFYLNVLNNVIHCITAPDNSKTENQKSNLKLDEQPKKKDDESKDNNSPT